MKPQPRKRKKLHIGKGLRLQIFAWCTVVGAVLLVGAGGTFAWYSMAEKKAETNVANVCLPYNLTIKNSGEAATEQLAIGSLQQGEKKQIVFGVTNEEESQINLNKADFEYGVEVIYTNNLALNYELYQLTELSEAPEQLEDVFVFEKSVTDAEGKPSTAYHYWQKSGNALAKQDVSGVRHEQVGLIGTDNTPDNIEDIINRGTYLLYEKTTDDSGNVLNDNLKLEVIPKEGDTSAEEFTTQYFVLEISWSISTGFEKYDKETDMIYIMAKAVQPKPEVAE